ncbi:MAG: polysaccharide deacetylase family protein [Anaerolineae bacterium]|nr:polysaccharide deacetylase family protein [Anaerolineae bacterium]
MRIRKWLLLFLFVVFVEAHSTYPQDTFYSDGTLRRIRVPILMYHYISPLPEDADDVRIDLTVEPDLFREHLQYLHDNSYQTISLYDLNAALLMGTPLPDKPVILTFDDSYSDHYTYVYPLLRDFDFTGTFFVITGLVDAGAPGYLDWTQVQEMAEAGMSMEPHTKSHQSLTERDYDFLVYEMLGSRESLAGHTGQGTHMFSYPAGRYDDATLAVAGQLGIWRAVTTEAGMLHTTDNMLEMPRVRVHGGTNAAGLAYLLKGDWLN